MAIVTSLSSSASSYAALALICLMEQFGAATAALEEIEGQWQRFSEPFTARDKFQAVCFDKRERITDSPGAVAEIILVGGRETDTTPSDDVYKYDSGTDRWEQIPTTGSIPAVYAFAMQKMMTVNEIYAFGGVTGRNAAGQEVFSDELWALELPSDSTQEWRWKGPLSKFDGFPAIKRMSSWTHRAKVMYEEVIDVVEPVDPTNDSDNSTHIVQKTKTHTLHKEYFVTFGGLTEVQAISTVFAYELPSTVTFDNGTVLQQGGSWVKWYDAEAEEAAAKAEQRSPIPAPSPRFDPCCASGFGDSASYDSWNGGDVTLCFGGTDYSGDTNELWAFDNEQKTWNNLAAGQASVKPAPRRLAHCARQKHDLHVWSGWNSADGTPVATGNTSYDVLWSFRANENATDGGWIMEGTQPPEARDSGVLCSAAVVPPSNQRNTVEVDYDDFNIFLMGGWYSRDGGTRSNDLWKWDRVAKRFKEIVKSTRRPSGRAGHVFVAPTASAAYLFFGMMKDGSYPTDVWKLPLSPPESNISGQGGELYEWEAVDAKSMHGLPVGRSHAAFATRGTRIFIFGGQDEHGNLLNDLWSFDVRWGEWENIFSMDNAASERNVFPEPRLGAAMANFDQRLVVYGGKTAHPTNPLPGDTWVYDMEHNDWFLAAVEGSLLADKPAARYGAALVQTYFYSSTEPQTRRLSVPSSQLEDGGRSRRRTTDLSDRFDANSNIRSSLLLLGGIGITTYSDRWRLSLSLTYDEDTYAVQYKVAFTELGSTIPGSESQRSFIRARAAVAGSGNRHFVCGGLISDDFPAPGQSTCYVYNARTGRNTLLPRQPSISVSDAGGVYVQNRLITFGGRLNSDILLRDFFSVSLNVFSVGVKSTANLDSSDVVGRRRTTIAGANDMISGFMCGDLASDDTDCFHCSVGSRNNAEGTCPLVRAGDFSFYPFNSQACQAGHFSTSVGAVDGEVCNVCPAGQYADGIGSTSCKLCSEPAKCTLGSTSTTGSTVASSGLGISDTALGIPNKANNVYIDLKQPPAMPLRAIPVTMYVFMILIALLPLALFIVFLVLKKVLKKLRYSRYFGTADGEDGGPTPYVAMKNVYRKYAMPGFGLTRTDLYNSVATMQSDNNRRLGNVQSPLKNIKKKDFSVTDIDNYFRQFDADGSGFIGKGEWYDIVIECINENIIAPFAGTEVHEEKAKRAEEMKDELKDEKEMMEDKGGVSAKTRVMSALDNVQLSALDMFTDGHRIGKAGDPIRLQKNTAGGIGSCMFFIGVVVLVMFSLLQFTYENLLETTSSFPLSLSQVQYENRSVSADRVLLTATIVGPFHSGRRGPGKSAKDLCLADGGTMDRNGIWSGLCTGKVTYFASSWEEALRENQKSGFLVNASSGPVQVVPNVSVLPSNTENTNNGSVFEGGLFGEKNKPVVLNTALYSSIESFCSYNVATEECSMSVACDDCAFGRAGGSEKKSFLFQFTAVHSAKSMRLKATTSTGIENNRQEGVFKSISYRSPMRYDITPPRHIQEESAVTVSVLHPTSADHVFTGWPPSRLNIDMLPTFFETPEGPWSLLRSSNNINTGFHLSTKPFVQGRTVDFEDFSHYYGVPIVFDVERDETSVIIKRVNKLGVLNLVISILGLVPGVMAACLFVVRLHDGRSMGQRQKEYEEAVEEGDYKAQSIPPLTESDRAVIDGLLQYEMGLGTAVEVLRISKHVTKKNAVGVLEDDDDPNWGKAQNWDDADVLGYNPNPNPMHHDSPNVVKPVNNGYESDAV